MANPYPALITDANSETRVAGQITFTDSANQPGGGMSVASVQLTNAQIKALPTTAVQLVAAPGSGKVLVPIFCYMHMAWVADYTNIGSLSRVGIEWGTTFISTVLPLQESVANNVSNLLADGASHPATLAPALTVNSPEVSGVGQSQDDPGPTNAALNLYAVNDGTHTGDFTGGDVGNSLKVSVYYVTFTN